jgi:ribosomal protein L11 methylase PrmA
MIFTAVIAIAMFLSVIIGVPFVPVKKKEAREMIACAEIKPGMKVIDLGSGAGQFLFLSAKQGAVAVGYELNPLLCLWTRWKIFFKKLKEKVSVRCESIYKADLHDADIVFTYLMPGPMKKLADKLFLELPNKAKIISYGFHIPDHEPIKTVGKIYVYEVIK